MLIFFEGSIAQDKRNQGKLISLIDLLISEFGAGPHRVWTSGLAPSSFESARCELFNKTKSPIAICCIFDFFSASDFSADEKRSLLRIARTSQAIEISNEQRTCLEHISWRNAEPTEIFEKIKSLIELPIPSNGIGAFKEGNILIVGEKPGPKAGGIDTPFVGETGCGPWLSRILEDAAIDETKLFWINAKNCFGQLADLKIVDDLKPSKIIALGNNAAAWCKEFANKYEIIKIPHPQFWKRFKSKESYPLIEELQKACQKIPA